MHIAKVIGVILVAAGVVSAKGHTNLSTDAQSLFDYSMTLNDARFDETYKYIIYEDNGLWSVRFTSWYVPGLLWRNEGNDLENARAAISNMQVKSIQIPHVSTNRSLRLANQMTDNFTAPWYGTWKLSPDEPTPTFDSTLYPPSIYETYDPNWREFVGTQLVQIVEEFSHLIGTELVDQIVKALEVQAIGAMRRDGTNGDNLVTAYTNPGLMRSLTVGWVGHRTSNQTLVDFADSRASDIYKLFTAGSNVFGEYNAPTYYGTNVWALAASIKYGPANQFLTQNAPFLLSELWRDIVDHYNPFLGNLAGPYDRANSRDLTQDSAILPLWFWGLHGYPKAPEPNLRQVNLEFDAAEGASMALVMSTIVDNVPASILESLTKAPTSDREFSKTIQENLNGTGVRVATSWVSKSLMAGGIEQYETIVRSQQSVPAIVHWASDAMHKPFPLNGFFSLYPTASTIKAVATANKLVISYPNATQIGSDSFQFMIVGIPPAWNLAGHIVSGFSNLPCLNVHVSAPGLELQPTTYGSSLYNRYYYNVTYTVPAGFLGVPKLSFDLEYTC